MQRFRTEADRQGLIAICVRLTARFKTIILFILIIELVLNSINIITAFDFPWQLAEGEYILQHGHPAKTVLQAYGEASPHLANEYILYEVLLAVINHAAGWAGLCVFFAFLSFFIYTPCLLALLRTRGHYSLLILPPFFLAQFVANDRLAARPELIADDCYLILGMMLLGADERSWGTSKILGLGLIFCIWANVHGSFLLGLIMLAFWYGQLFLFRWKSLLAAGNLTWLWPGLAAVVGCSLNPSGVVRFVQPFQLHGLLWGQGTSFEMWPLTIDAAWPTLAAAAMGLVLLSLRKSESPSYWLGALLLALQWLTFSSNRYGIFVALTLFVILWDWLKASEKNANPQAPTLVLSFGRLTWCLVMTLTMEFLVACQFNAKLIVVQGAARSFYPNTLVATSSSFAWLKTQSSGNQMVLSSINVGSWSQMPGSSDIHSLLDSGTHRFTDSVNQLYYYALFSPDHLRRIVSDLHVNAIVLSNMNIYWAPILNANPEWRLAQVGPDAQLYLHENNSNGEAERQSYLNWEKDAQLESPESIKFSFFSLVRGLGLRPDAESLRLLTLIFDNSWTFDPQITYLQEWLDQVPDNLVEATIKNLGEKMDDRSSGLRILLLLRLKHDDEAAACADQWKPSLFAMCYQTMQELRAQAYLRASRPKLAQSLLAALWPQPRYSLRWAKLCQLAYANEPQAMPQNARLLTGMADKFDWQVNTLAVLNNNILQLTSPSP